MQTVLSTPEDLSTAQILSSARFVVMNQGFTLSILSDYRVIPKVIQC